MEMERVRIDAHEAGDATTEARALTALAEVALFRDSDVTRARQLAEHALEIVPDGERVARFDALNVLRTCAWWSADLSESERYARDLLALAQEGERPDLEARAAGELAHIFVVRGETEEAAPLIERAQALADASGSILAQAWACSAAGDYYLLNDELEEARTALERSLELFAEAGNASMLGRVQFRLARVMARLGDAARAERLYRDSIRVLKPLQDRGTIVESQRGLAELLLSQGKLDAAEKHALAARETVGPEDVTSLATTALALGRVRAAQGRDDEAEALLRESVERLSGTDCHKFVVEPLRSLAQFLRERGRDDEAAAVEERLPESAAKIA
jgi:tetratricopeptide (TPR) repeat protein